MTPIIPIHKDKLVDYSSKIISYFKVVIPEKNAVDVKDINYKLQSAKNTVCIASTTDIHTDIIKELYPLIDKNVRVYIILPSFDNCKRTLDQFGKSKPALIREVSDIKNNFILIDDEAYFCMSSLGKSENHFIELNMEYRKDLSYWFSYYFWNKASKEKILDQIQNPLQSPYPNFEFATKHIKRNNNEITSHVNCIVPNDSKYADLNRDGMPFYLSSETDTPVYIHENGSSIGDLFIADKNLSGYIGSQWELMEGMQGDVSEPIIPFDSKEWNNKLRINDETSFEIGNIAVKTIEEIVHCKPMEFPPVPYVNKVQYKWIVIPPYKPTGITTAKLYDEYNRLQKEFEKATDELRTILESILNEKSKFIGLFSGRTRKAKEYLNQIEDWRKLDLKEMEYIELKDFVNEEFPKFYMMINTERKELSLDIEKRAQEEKWSKEKNNKESKAQEIEERIRSLTSEISKIKELKESKRKIYAEYDRLQKIDNEWKKISDETLKDFDEFKTSITDKEMHETIIQFSISSKDDLVNKLSKSKIEKDNITQNINSYSSIDKLEKDEKEARRQLEILKREIKEKYERFIFKPGISEVSHTKKNNHNSIKQLPCPKYPLPEVGELFEDSNSYYLEIEHYEEISKANEIAKNRYIDKPCHVVAKERK